MKNSHTKCLLIRENDHNSRCLCRPCENFLLSSLSLLVKSFEEEIQPSRHLNTSRGETFEYLQGLS